MRVAEHANDYEQLGHVDYSYAGGSSNGAAMGPDQPTPFDSMQSERTDVSLQTVRVRTSDLDTPHLHTVARTLQTWHRTLSWCQTAV